MADAPKYKKVAAGGGSFERQKLYFGDDHLLVIDGTYSERYRRLYYKDIQALLRYPTAGSIILQVILIFILIPSLIGLLSGDEFAWGYLFPIVPIGLILAYSIYLGRSCRIALKTQVQLVRLSAVGNLRKARKFEARLTERVEQAQGRLTAEALQDALRPPQSATTF